MRSSRRARASRAPRRRLPDVRFVALIVALAALEFLAAVIAVGLAPGLVIG